MTAMKDQQGITASPSPYTKRYSMNFLFRVSVDGKAIDFDSLSLEEIDKYYALWRLSIQQEREPLKEHTFVPYDPPLVAKRQLLVPKTPCVAIRQPFQDRRWRHEMRPNCPACGQAMCAWGRSKGWQKWKCRDCGKWGATRLPLSVDSGDSESPKA